MRVMAMFIISVMNQGFSRSFCVLNDSTLASPYRLYYFYLFSDFTLQLLLKM